LYLLIISSTGDCVAEELALCAAMLLVAIIRCAVSFLGVLAVRFNLAFFRASHSSAKPG
jgi:hypothetical protein